MGSISTIEDESKVYDAIYKIARDSMAADGISFYYKDTLKQDANYPQEYVYLDQIHDAYEKETLQPNIYAVPVEFLCEINVSHANIAKGRRMSKAVQRAFHRKASSCGIVVKGAMATDSVTKGGQRFVVSMNLIYTTRMV